MSTVESTVEKFHKQLMDNVLEFTHRWWTERDEAQMNFFYHVDDSFYEQVLRQEAEELLEIVFAAFRGSNREPLERWSKLTAAKRATQEVPIDEAVERFRMFRHILLDYWAHFVEREGLSAAESLRVAEVLSMNVELALQSWMTEYRRITEHFANEQKRRFDMERLASIGQMAAGVAHEVRNPLTATYGFLQLLAETQPHQFLEIAMSELQRGIQTISTLLDVAKPNAPQAPMRPLYLSTLLRQVLEIFQDKLYDKQVVLDFRDEEVAVAGRAEMLKQAFFNVIKNALEAMQGTPKPSLTLRHYQVEKTLVVEIEDNGGGLPVDKVHLLGTPFFTMKDGGVGLGLTMVYRTMHEHFAQVNVDSAYGEGMRFRFTFPL